MFEMFCASWCVLFVFVVGGGVCCPCGLYRCACVVCHVLCGAGNFNCLFVGCLCVFVCVLQMCALCVSTIVRCCEMGC